MSASDYTVYKVRAQMGLARRLSAHPSVTLEAIAQHLDLRGTYGQEQA